MPSLSEDKVKARAIINSLSSSKTQRKKESQDRFNKIFYGEDDTKTKRTLKGEIFREGLSGAASLVDLPVAVGNIGTWATDTKSLPYPSEVVSENLERFAGVQGEPKTEAQKIFGKVARFAGAGLGGLGALGAKGMVKAGNKLSLPNSITPKILRNRNPNLIQKTTPQNAKDWAALAGAGAGAGYASTISDDPFTEFLASVLGGKGIQGLTNFKGLGKSAVQNKLILDGKEGKISNADFNKLTIPLQKKAQLTNTVYEIDPDKYDQLMKLGITPSFGAVGNAAAKYAEDSLLNTAIGNKYIAPIRAEQFKQLQALSEPFEKYVYDPNNVGEMLRNAAQKSNTHAYNQTEKLRAKAFLPEIMVKNRGTGARINEVMDKGTELATEAEYKKPYGQVFSKILEDFAKNQGMLPVQTVDHYRNELLNFLNPASSLYVGNTQEGAIKAVRGILKGDAFRSISEKSPEAAKALAEYKKAYANWSNPQKGTRKIEEKLIKKELGHDIYTQFETALKKGNTRVLDVMTKQLSPKDRIAVVSSYLKQTGKKGSENIDFYGANNKFNILPKESQKRLLSMLPKEASEKLSAIFSSAALLKEVQDKANHSGTAHSILSWLGGKESGDWYLKPFSYLAMKEKSKYFSDPTILKAAYLHQKGKPKNAITRLLKEPEDSKIPQILEPEDSKIPQILEPEVVISSKPNELKTSNFQISPTSLLGTFSSQKNEKPKNSKEKAVAVLEALK